jgi:SAM-dependent methyltransferase
MTNTVNRDLRTLLELLVCPSCQSELSGDSEHLRCTGCGNAFSFHGRVPMLQQKTVRPEKQSLLARLQYALLGDPRVYDFQQAHGGGHKVAAHVRTELGDVGGATLLDIGAGTGVLGGLIPPETRYVWFDNDTLKLRGLLSKRIDCWAVLGDAAQLPFKSGAADWAVMVEVSHHLPDGALRACFRETARVTRNRFVFADAVRGPRLRSRLLWQLDLGRYPRREEELIAALARCFELERVERFRIHHDYVLCVCRPVRSRSVSSSR